LRRMREMSVIDAFSTSLNEFFRIGMGPGAQAG
jgi:hypothetical protein